MIHINLVAEGRKPIVHRGRSSSAFSFASENLAIWCLIGVLVVVLASYGTYWFLLQRDLDRRKEQIAEARETMIELQGIIKEVERFAKQKQQLEHKIQVIGDLRDNQRGPVEIMDQVSKALPELLWLDQLTLTARAVTIGGRSFTTNAVASFIENLDQVREFQEPVLRNTTWNGQIYSFQVVFNYSAVPIRAVRDTEAPEEVASADATPAR